MYTATLTPKKIKPPLAPESSVPFMRPEIGDQEINEVVDTLKSGWLTTGPKTKCFEENFARAVGGKYAVALNSCTAALHLAVIALDLRPGQAVLVPTMTFAATAEIIHYAGAIPLLVDCDPATGNMDLKDAEIKLKRFRTKRIPFHVCDEAEVVGIIPVHVGGFMLDIEALCRFAERHNLWIIEDAAHAFPAAWRKNADSKWQFCGENTAAVTCYSFYANKTITTGEGGMAVTNDALIAERIRLLSLHGLSHDAWGRYSGAGAWDYQIVAAGYKYNLTDIAAAIGIHQLSKAENMRLQREAVAEIYLEQLADVEEIKLPPVDDDRIHSWHLFPIRLNIELLSIDRNDFIAELKTSGIGCSVHWRPLHLHPFYRQTYSWSGKDFPVATDLWSRLISIPIFPGMKMAEIEQVIRVIKNICTVNSTKRLRR